MNLPILQPQLFLGLDAKLRKNVHYLTNDEIVYPVGSVVAVHDFSQKKQRYIKLTNKGRNLTHVLVSPDKKTIAVIEFTDKLPVVTLWDTTLYRKRKTLELPNDREIIATRYVCADFSHDSKYLVCVTGEPDWSFYCFRCDKGKLESNAKANNANGIGTVHQICYNTNDVNQLAIVGESVLRCLGCQEFAWRPFGYNKIDGVTYTACSWLSQDRLIVGSNRGKIMILETGEIRAVFHASDMPIINLKQKDEMDEINETVNPSAFDEMGASSDLENFEIRTIVNFSRGFAFGYMNGKVHLYERETPHRFRKRGIFNIPDRSIKREYEDKPEVLTTVNTIAINPDEDSLMVTCGEIQLWSGKLWRHDASTGIEINLKEYGFSMHLGPIGCMAICRWKPMLVTAGARDRSIKIWNYETSELDLVQNFEDDIYCVALHPNGLYTAVGFSDKLRLMTIMIDDIVTTKEFSIRSCKLASFSTLGHLFAATQGNQIYVYSCITFDQMYVLKGHNGRITSLSWSGNDTILASCGTEGAVYGWDVIKESRLNETIIKANPFSGVAITKDGKNILAIGDDGHIRELANSNVHRDVVLTPPNVPLDQIALSALDNMLFVSGNGGVIYVVKLPLLEKAEFTEYIMQNLNLTKMVISCNDMYLISGCMDGSLCFWKILNAEDKAIKYELGRADEILISRQILEDKMQQIKNLQLRMKELETEHSYQMRQNDVSHSLKLKDIHAGYCNAIEELKTKNEQLENEHIQEINSMTAHINQIKADHEQQLEKLEASYNEKLIIEYHKYISLESTMAAILKEWESKYHKLQDEMEEMETSLTNKYNEMVKGKEMQYEELMELYQKKNEEHEKIKQQIEDDADREIYELKESHARELKEEQDLNVRIRGESNVVKKKLATTQKEVEDLKHKIFNMENEHVKFKTVIYGMEREIADVKKETQERDRTIEEKEKRIFQLKSKNQELEKFKFILDFKIKELKSQIEPRERTIQEQITQINEMVRELENLQKVILNLDLQLIELKEKLAASNNEVKAEVEKNRKMKKALQAIRSDIHHASGLVQNYPMLQRAVKDMYHKYNADKDFEVAQAEDTEAKNEFLRQRDFLERTVATLHYQATKNTSSLSYDKVRLVEENAALLVETNHLRRHLQSEINQRGKLTALVGLSYMTPKMAQQKINMACTSNKEIYQKFKDQLEENENCIKALTEENKRLVEKLIEIDNVPKFSAEKE